MPVLLMLQRPFLTSLVPAQGKWRGCAELVLTRIRERTLTRELGWGL